MQAALNTLKEERRRVVAARSAVFADDALHARDPRHRQQLLKQMATELVEHGRAIDLIEQIIAAGIAPVNSVDRSAVVRRLHAAGTVAR